MYVFKILMIELQTKYVPLVLHIIVLNSSFREQSKNSSFGSNKGKLTVYTVSPQVIHPSYTSTATLRSRCPQ